MLDCLQKDALSPAVQRKRMEREGGRERKNGVGWEEEEEKRRNTHKIGMAKRSPPLPPFPPFSSYTHSDRNGIHL